MAASIALARSIGTTNAALSTSTASVCTQCSRQLRRPRQIHKHALAVDPSRIRQQSSWAAAAAVASNLIKSATRSDPPLPAGMKIDPFRSVAKELKFLSSNIRGIIGSGHPILDTVSKYYTQAEGKHIRPMLVLLMSQATALIPRSSASPFPPQPEADINKAITYDESVLADENPSASTLSTLDPHDDNTSIIDNILPSQRRLAEITELIHTASLLHDDVIDNSTSRRGQPSVNIAFGNKMAVLAGDFLLGRASVALARLRNPEVTELLATVIANLIEGEFMQLRNTPSAENKIQATTSDSATLEYYLQKTYLKSASLISKSVRAAALLGGCDRAVVDASYSYGKNLGLAFQLVDDMLDFTAADDLQLGKPAGADLELGLATAPLLFAWRERPELGELVERRFEGEGDALKARQIVLQSSGLEQTRALAQEYVDNAAAAISSFPESDAKSGLIDMCNKVMSRKK